MTAPDASPRTGQVPERRLRTAEQAENFPVALRVLPARLRARLRAVYDVVRTIDDLGDEGTGGAAERTSALQAFAADLDRVWAPAADPVDPVLRALVPHAAVLPQAPFVDLVAANLADQHVLRYATWDELLGYCALSANPIGRLVLAAFEVGADARTERASDQVCTALQLLEHWQDVAEDHARGRVYLPAAELTRHGVDPDDPLATPARLRVALAAATTRAEALLDDGAEVVARVHGWARIAVAGYVAGGRAAAAALRRAGFDVGAGAPQARRSDVAVHLAGELWRAR